MERLSDEMLDMISGGTDPGYTLENDPLFKKFSQLEQKEGSKANGGMESRAEFIGSFKEWVSNGMPDSLKGQKKKDKS